MLQGAIVTILRGSLYPSCRATRLDNSRGWTANRFAFRSFSDDLSYLVRGLPSTTPREFGPVTGWFGLVREVVVPVEIDQQITSIAFDVVSFSKRHGIDLTRLDNVADLEKALRKKALAKALPQLSNEEIEAVENGNLPPGASPIKQVLREGGDLWVTVEEWGCVARRIQLCQRTWNYTKGEFKPHPFTKGINPLTLPRNLRAKRGLSPEDIACIQEGVKNRYMECWKRVSNTKKAVQETLELPGGFNANLTFERSGEVTVRWKAYNFTEIGRAQIFEYRWELLQNVVRKDECNAPASYAEKKVEFLNQRPSQFRRSLLERCGAVNISQEDAGLLADALVARPDTAFVLNDRFQVARLDDGSSVLNLGEQNWARFMAVGQLPKIERSIVYWDLLSGTFRPDNNRFFKQNPAFISNHLTAAGMDLGLADTINNTVIENFEFFMYQVFSSGTTYTVRKGTHGLPYGLEFDVEGRGWVKIKDQREHPQGATKKGKQAYSLFTEDNVVMRLVSHPHLGEVSSLTREFSLLRELQDVPGIVRPIALTAAVNKRGEATLSLYENRCNLGALNDYVEYLSYSQRDRVIEGLLVALASLHDQKIVHRDLKETNIYLSTVKWARFSTDLPIDPAIGDFDLALKVTSHQKPCPFGGTYRYLSPEKARAWLGRSSWTEYEEFASDVWALGVVFANLVQVPGKAGKLSFEELSQLQPKDQKVIVSKISSSMNFDGLVDQMLQIDPRKRLSASESLMKWKEMPKKTHLLRFVSPFRGREPKPFPNDDRAQEQAPKIVAPNRPIEKREDHFG